MTRAPSLAGAAFGRSHVSLEFPSPPQARWVASEANSPEAPRVSVPMPRIPLFRVLPLLLAALPLACGGTHDYEARGLVVINPATPERPLYFDFDVVPEGEVREHTYVLQNTDPVPVVVHKLQSSCGCTVPRVVAIAPDGTETAGRLFDDGTGDVVTVPVDGKLEVTVITDTKHVRVKNQHKLNTVRLTCSSENEPYLSFEQHLWVTLAFNATPSKIDLGLVPEGGGKAGSSELFPAQDGSLARVTGVHSATPGLTVTFHEEPRPRGNITIVTAELEPGMPRGQWLGEVRLDCTREDGETDAPPFLLQVQGLVTTDVVCIPRSLIFDDLDPEEGVTINAVVQALVPGERVRITGHRLTGDLDGVEVSYEPDAVGADGRSVRWNLKLVVGPEAAGRKLRGNLEIDTDVESAGTLLVPVTGSF
jgi:uncharacterized protein DUF1573